MRFKEWLREWYNGLFHPFNDFPPEAFMTERGLEELFASAESDEWESE